MIKPHLRRNLFLAIIILTSHVLHAQTKVAGQVVDGSTGRPLPFTTLYSPDLKRGTTSDMDGRFELSLGNISASRLEISCVGYQKKILDLDSSAPRWITVKLKESPIDLAEVVIDSDDSLAVEIIRKAVRRKSTNDPAELRSYRYQSYNKLYSTLNRFNIDSVRDAKDTLALSRFLQENHLFLSESFTSRYHAAPSYDKEIVLANRFSGFKDPTFTILASTFQPFSFYRNSVRVLDVDFVSPLADKSWNQYHFSLENVVQTGLKDTLFVVSFWPKNKNQLSCLSGTITITSDQYAIANIQTSTTDSKSLLTLSLTQKYSRHGTTSFPDQLNTEVKFNNVQVHGANVIFVYKGYFKEIEINPVLVKEHFDDVYLEFKADANSKSELFWNSIRGDSSSRKDRNTYKFYDTLPKKVLSMLQATQWLTQTVALRYIPLKYVNVHLDRVLLFNQYEGARPGIGISTSPGFSRYIKVGGYAGFGLNDRALKFDGNLSFLIHKRTSSQLALSYSQDVAEGASPFINDNIINGSRLLGLRNLIVNRMDSVTKIRLEYSMQPIPFFWVAANITNQVINPTYTYSFFNGDEQTTGFNVTASELKLYYAKGQAKIQVGKGTTYMRPTFPIAELKISKAFQNFAGSQFGFTKVHANLIHAFRLPRIGTFTMNAAAGYVHGAAPYPFLFNANGLASDLHASKFCLRNAFQLIGVNEFLSDRYVALFLNQTVGLLWNTRRSRPEVNLSQAMTVGGLSNPHVHSGLTFHTLERGYFESGVVVNNIFRLNYLNMFYLGLGTGVFYRYGSHYSNPSDNFGVRASITYSY
jgi:hypothetical protein